MRNAGVVEALRPPGVRRAVLVRLARLLAEAVAVAEAVAMLGEGPEVRGVARLAGLDEDAAARGLGVLARAEILRTDPPIGFVHPLGRPTGAPTSRCGRSGTGSCWRSRTADCRTAAPASSW